GTVKERLERGRELLRRRLTRRGIGLGAVLPAALLGLATPAPAALVASAVRGALGTGSPTAGAAALAGAALRGTASPRLQVALAPALALCGLAAGAGWLGYRALAENAPEVQGQDLPAVEVKAPEPAPPAERQPEAAPKADPHGDALPAGALAR